MRVKAVIAYDGSAYHGFQKQTSTKNTVSTSIEDALLSLHISSPITGSGRTDAGVHATGQIIHFDLPSFWKDLEKLKRTLNQILTDIYFKHIMKVDDDFHARFSAKRRVYRYVFKTHIPSVFEHKYISYYAPFDPTILLKALQNFEGKHDFNFFHKTGSSPHTTVREIYHTNYIKYQGYHIIYFHANGFLRAQVRMMIDMAMSCATHKMTLAQLKKQLACQEKYSTKLAPPEGLYLARILYHSTKYTQGKIS